MQNLVVRTIALLIRGTVLLCIWREPVAAQVIQTTLPSLPPTSAPPAVPFPGIAPGQTIGMPPSLGAIRPPNITSSLVPAATSVAVPSAIGSVSVPELGNSGTLYKSMNDATRAGACTASRVCFSQSSAKLLQALVAQRGSAELIKALVVLMPIESGMELGTRGTTVYEIAGKLYSANVDIVEFPWDLAASAFRAVDPLAICTATREIDYELLRSQDIDPFAPGEKDFWIRMRSELSRAAAKPCTP